MAKIYQIFKGGFSHGHDERIAVNQRPADGHLKSASWEDFARLSKDNFNCGGLPKLEVGDVIQLHAGLTFGVIDALGIAVKHAEEGLKFKIVISDDDAQNKFEMAKGFVFEWDDAQKQFTHTGNPQEVSKFNDIGDSQKYYAFYAAAAQAEDLLILPNSAAIGLEVVALPAAGLNWTFEIESRLHMRQAVRPPAHLCCGC